MAKEIAKHTAKIATSIVANPPAGKPETVLYTDREAYSVDVSKMVDDGLIAAHSSVAAYRKACVHAVHFAILHGSCGYMEKLLSAPPAMVLDFKRFLNNFNATMGKPSIFVLPANATTFKINDDGATRRKGIQAKPDNGLPFLNAIPFIKPEAAARASVDPFTAIVDFAKRGGKRLMAEYPNDDTVRRFVGELDKLSKETARIAYAKQDRERLLAELQAEGFTVVAPEPAKVAA